MLAVHITNVCFGVVGAVGQDQSITALQSTDARRLPYRACPR